MNIAPNQKFTFIEMDRDAPPQGFDMRDLLFGLRRRLRLMALTALLVAVAVLALTLSQPRQYTATATIMINPAVERVVSQEQALTESHRDTTALVDSELEVIRSPDFAERLVRDLRLDRDPRWVGEEDAAARANAPANAPIDLGLTDRVANAISARRRGDSYAIDVSATTGNPAESARMANSMVELYRQADFEARSESGARANAWLEARLQTLRLDVQQKEAAAQVFRAQSGLLSSGGVPLTETQIGSVQTEVLRARADLAAAEAQFQQAQTLFDAGESGETLDSVLASDTIRDLRDREADLLRRQAGYETNLTSAHPAVANGQAEIDNVRQQIRVEIARIQAGLRNNVQTARVRLQTLEGSLNSVRGNLVSNNQSLLNLNELDREAEAARNVYESFLQRRHEVSGQAEIDGAGVRTIASARPPLTPSSPKVALSILLAIACGLLAGLMTALIAEIVDDRLYTSDGVARRTGAKLLGSVPRLRRRELAKLAKDDRHPAAYLAAKPTSAFAEAFRVLKTTLSHAADGAIRVVAVTSAAPNEGKTTTSLCLARMAALSGHKAILVECDLRRRRVQDLLGVAPEAGLRDVLAEGKPWRSVVLQDTVSPADILPCGPGEFSSLDLFETDAMRGLIQSLREHYDLIVLDCAPVLAVAETRVVASHADGAILIAQSGKSRARSVKAAITQTESAGGAVVGVVLNCIDPRAPGKHSYADPLFYEYGREGYYRA